MRLTRFELESLNNFSSENMSKLEEVDPWMQRKLEQQQQQSQEQQSQEQQTEVVEQSE